jgi:hypothetical protein
VNDSDTSVLSSRLRRLADELAPPLDVVGQVRHARSRRRRQRRVRITLVAAATVTVAVMIGVPLALGSMTSASSGGVAGPAPTSAQRSSSGPTGIPDGWEPRTFRGVTFAVPPGARADDTVTDLPVSSWDGPSVIWNGPHLGGDLYSSVNVTITQPFEGGLPPRGGGRPFTVPGAETAYGNIETALMSDGVVKAERTVVWLEVLAGDRVVNLDAVFDGGPSGQKMAEDLVASMAVG